MLLYDVDANWPRAFQASERTDNVNNNQQTLAGARRGTARRRSRAAARMRATWRVGASSPTNFTVLENARDAAADWRRTRERRQRDVHEIGVVYRCAETARTFARCCVATRGGSAHGRPVAVTGSYARMPRVRRALYQVRIEY